MNISPKSRNEHISERTSDGKLSNEAMTNVTVVSFENVLFQE